MQLICAQFKVNKKICFDHKLGLDEADKEPILTTLHTAKIDNVPFPAVTIGGDSNVNKWGFAEKIFNFLAFYYPKVINYK